MALLMTLVLVVGMMSACGKKNDDPSGTTSTEAPTDDANAGDEVTPTDDASADPIDVELLVWGPQEDQAPVEGYEQGLLPALCEQFNELHPEWNIKFTYGVCGEDIAKDEVTKDVEAAADVFMYANDQIPVMVDAGAIARIGGTALDTIKATNSESMVTSVTYGDAVYGVPFTSNTWFMYYDKSKFTEDEVKSLDTMMAKDLGDGVTNFAFPLSNSWYIAAFYYAAGGQLFGDGTDGTAGNTFGELTDVTKYLVDLAKNPKFSNETDGSSIAKFQDGKLGAYCSGSWDAAAIKEALGDNFAATKIPTVTINGTEGQMKSFAGSKAIGVNPTSEFPEVAVALALYLGGEEAQLARYQTRQIIPTHTALAGNAELADDVVANAIVAELTDASVAQPVLAEMANYWTPAETMGKEIVQGDVTADNAEAKTKAMGDAMASSGL